MFWICSMHNIERLRLHCSGDGAVRLILHDIERKFGSKQVVKQDRWWWEAAHDRDRVATGGGCQLGPCDHL